MVRSWLSIMWHRNLWTRGERIGRLRHASLFQLDPSAEGREDVGGSRIVETTDQVRYGRLGSPWLAGNTRCRT
jgi:hypothetical protein